MWVRVTRGLTRERGNEKIEGNKDEARSEREQVNKNVEIYQGKKDNEMNMLSDCSLWCFRITKQS